MLISLAWLALLLSETHQHTTLTI